MFLAEAKAAASAFGGGTSIDVVRVKFGAVVFGLIIVEVARVKGGVEDAFVFARKGLSGVNSWKNSKNRGENEDQRKGG